MGKVCLTDQESHSHVKPESEFLTSQAEYCWSCGHNSNVHVLFECGPPNSPTSTSHPPDVIHIISVFTPSPFFTPLPLYYQTKEPKLAHPLHRRVPDNTKLHYRQVRPWGWYVTAVLHISYHRGQAKYHSNPCSQHSQPVSRPSHCPSSPVYKNGGGRYVFLTHLNVYLGKQERGGRGNGGKGGI